eukprot:CAMPEP_0114523862 /NCGR_PEP_ID=MMETSP0109-20121206/21528_1 /TAXON_ID=29199 /ORGANISM="Chlorarachnion reptans, Strain CCCM449" /LENGTH=399 /DNA_ID=CAMNT_0001705227 /DNA_START=136 /DNA_END=1336 /DNA_ORIENTATION=-
MGACSSSSLRSPFKRTGKTDPAPAARLRHRISSKTLLCDKQEFESKDRKEGEDAKQNIAPFKLCALSPRCDQLATVSAAHGMDTIVIWRVDMKEPIEIWRLKGHNAPITDLVFDSNIGLYLLTTAMDGTVRVWNPNAGKLLRTFETKSARDKTFNLCSISCDGEYIAGFKGSTKQISLWMQEGSSETVWRHNYKSGLEEWERRTIETTTTGSVDLPPISSPPSDSSSASAAALSMTFVGANYLATADEFTAKLWHLTDVGTKVSWKLVKQIAFINESCTVAIDPTGVSGVFRTWQKRSKGDRVTYECRCEWWQPVDHVDDNDRANKSKGRRKKEAGYKLSMPFGNTGGITTARFALKETSLLLARAEGLSASFLKISRPKNCGRQENGSGRFQEKELMA